MNKLLTWLVVNFIGVTTLSFIALAFHMTMDTLMGCLAGALVGLIPTTLIAIRGQAAFALQAFTLCTLSGGVFQLALMVLLSVITFNLIGMAALTFDILAGMLGAVLTAVMHIIATND